MELGGSATAFLAFALRLRKTSVRKLSGALSSVTSHCYKWGLLPPYKVERSKLPAPLDKSIWVCKRSAVADRP